MLHRLTVQKIKPLPPKNTAETRFGFLGTFGTWVLILKLIRTNCMAPQNWKILKSILILEMMRLVHQFF